MSVLKVVVHSVDNELETVILSDRQINLSQNVELDDYILKFFVAFKKSSAKSFGLVNEDSFLNGLVGTRDFEFMNVSKDIARAWFDTYETSHTYTSCNLIFALVETEESLEYAMFEVMGKSGYLKVVDDDSTNEIKHSMGILSDRFSSVKTAFSFDLGSGDLVVKTHKDSEEKLESILDFKTIPNARKSLEIVDAVVDELSSRRDDDILENRLKSNQILLADAELFEEIEPKRIVEQVFDSLEEEEIDYLNETIESTLLPNIIDSSAVNRLTSRKKHRIKTEFGIEVVLPLDSVDIDSVLEVETGADGRVNIVLKNVGSIE